MAAISGLVFKVKFLEMKKVFQPQRARPGANDASNPRL